MEGFEPRFLISRKGGFAMKVLEHVIEYLDAPVDEARAKREVVEVLDWIAGEVVKDGEG